MTIDQDYVFSHQAKIIAAIKRGAIFIYPTDTIYGLGCDATSEIEVRCRGNKAIGDGKAFSVRVPNKGWILDNCIVPDLSKLDFLPGPYTLILKMKNKNIVAENVSFGDTLGVRIPDNWFSKIVEESGVPFVSTSVNISGEKHMERFEDVPQSILDQVDRVVYEGEKRGESSTKIDLTQLQ